MTFAKLVRRNLTYFWRTNVAVVAGVGVAVAVLAGALLVGASVRGSLHELALLRLGSVDQVVTSGGFFREALADDLRSATDLAATFGDVCPLIILEGFVTHQENGRRASGVQVYGVDERFWRFHGRDPSGRAPDRNDVLLSEGLARELGGQAGDALLVRVEKPSAIPVSSLHGRKGDVGRTVRLLIRAVVSADELGEFSVRPQQGLARSVFVSLERLQGDLERPGQVNTILLGVGGQGMGASTDDSAARVALVETSLRERATLEDLGIKLRTLPAPSALSTRSMLTIIMEADAGLLSDEVAEAGRSAAEALGMRAQPILTYLANRIRLGDREVPYSLLTALDLNTLSQLLAPSAQPLAPSPQPPIVLNEWAADDLAATSGDLVSIEYYQWQDEGLLLTREAEFRVAGVVPLEGAAADPDLAPDYPGITQADSLFEWDPPFPIDLSLVGPRDEEYWDRYRTTPKAFLQLEAGQALWESRWGKLTSLRVFPSEGSLGPALAAFGEELRASLDPIGSGVSGFGVYPARALALEASVGATDFGEYFTYFSFFLVVSALLLASLFFRLGVEQRLKEIGMLRALGFPPGRIRTVFWSEALVLSVAGSVVGVAGAIAYADVIMYGLRTWWVDAVGTRLLTLHVSRGSLLLGVAGGTLAAVVSTGLTLIAVARATPRRLLSGSLPESPAGPLPRAAAAVVQSFSRPSSFLRLRPSSVVVAAMLAAAGLALLGAALFGLVGDTAGFFGAGTLFLVALLTSIWTWLCRRVPSRPLTPGTWAVVQIGFRNAAYRPGRSVLCIALIAAAAFIIVAVDAFRREGTEVGLDPESGTGGYTLLADSLLPIVYDLNTEAGRDELNLTNVEGNVLDEVAFARFRVRPGEDASCLNLYQPTNPRILAPTTAFVERDRFAFGRSLPLADDDPARANPWLLLDREQPDGAVPAIADATSLTYVLHLGVGDEFILNRDTDRPIRLRIVAALTDSIFQREILISERHFVELFPDQGGYRFFLVDAAPEAASAVTAVLEDRLADFGFDVVSAGERLAAFHRVENTYLATFQMLGGLGLLLGTFGLAAVLLRNVLERRRELALLRAVGYRSTHLSLMVIAENAFLLFVGLVTGTVCAVLAIAPAWLERGGQWPVASLGGLLVAVAVTGLAASVLATAAAWRLPLLESLRAE